MGGGIVAYSTSVKNGLLNVTDHDELKVMSKKTAIEMVEGLENIAENRINPELDKKTEYRTSADLYLSVTGASTHYNHVKPHFYVAFKARGKPAVSKLFQLN